MYFKYCPVVYGNTLISWFWLFRKFIKFKQNLASAASLSSYLWFLHHTSITPQFYRVTRDPIFLLVSPFSTLLSPPHFFSSSSPIFPLKLSVSPSHAILCVLFLAERCLVQPSVSYFSLFLSPSLSFFLSPSPVVPAKATHRRSFFLLLLLKSWKPCEVVWLSADGRAERVVSARLCVRWCLWVVGGIDAGRRERTSSSK